MHLVHVTSTGKVQLLFAWLPACISVNTGLVSLLSRLAEQEYTRVVGGVLPATEEQLRQLDGWLIDEICKRVPYAKNLDQLLRATLEVQVEVSGG